MPSTENRTVPAAAGPERRAPTREYLAKEVDRLIAAARENRYGLRVSELSVLRWDQVDVEHGLLHVRRIKNGTPSVHPLGGGELRALRKLQREAIPSRSVFTTKRRAPMSLAGFRKMLARTGEAGAPFLATVLGRVCKLKLDSGYAGFLS